MSPSPPSRTRPGPAVVAVLGVIVALAILSAGAWLALGRPVPGGSPPGPAGRATVVRVVDGDTLVVELAGTEQPVRLIGIDTPETVAPGRPVECFGAEASDHLRVLVPAGTEVRLERDVEPRDMYDRLLAYVYRARDGLFVNGAQVEGGYAEADDHPPNTALRAELHAVEAAARAGAAGLWGACGRADVAVAPPPGPSG